jgi:hypothetical protein
MRGHRKREYEPVSGGPASLGLVSVIYGQQAAGNPRNGFAENAGAISKTDQK